MYLKLQKRVECPEPQYINTWKGGETMKTIKQIADELGVSKTAVRKKIENLGLSEKVQTNGNRIEVDERQERLIKLAFSQKETKTTNANEVSEKSETLRLLSSMVSTLQEQLQEKDRQIERLQTELENAQKSVNQAQQLHAMTEQKLLLIEDRQEQEEQPKKWWQFWK